MYKRQFRGNNPVREAMHSAFLYHATQQGLDRCIVNAGMREVYDNIPKDRLELIEDVLLNRRTDATERRTDYAEKLAAEKTGDGKEKKTCLLYTSQANGSPSGAAGIPTGAPLRPEPRCPGQPSAAGSNGQTGVPFLR